MARSARVGSIAVAAATVLLMAAACGTAEPQLPAPAGPAIPQTLFDALPAEIKAAGVIRFAGDSHPPYRTIGADGSITGVDRDFQDALSRVLGVRIETRLVDGLPAALQGMLDGQFDAFNGPVKATAEREQQFDTITWMTTHTSYVVPAGSPITSSDDLCGRRVAVVTASVVEGQLARLSDYCQRDGQARAEAVPLADTDATLQAAESGRVDAAGMTQAAAIDVTSQRQGLSYVTQTREQGASTDFLAMLVPRESGLGPVMLEAFQQLFEDGTYADIVSRYGLSAVTIPEPVLNVNATSTEIPPP